MRTRHILFTSAAILTLLSCVKESVELPQGSIGDGTATRITLAIKSDARPSVGYNGTESQTNPAVSISRALPGTRALTPAQEGLIDNVHILIFDADGNIAANEHFGGLSITGTSSLSIDSKPGNGMQIVVVANGDVNDHKGATLDEKLNSITSLDALNDILVEIDGDGLSRTDRLMMVGKTTATITKPHKTAIPVELHFLDTKVTLTVKDNIPTTEAITITGWDIINIPKKSYLNERTAPAKEDAVVGTRPGDYTATNGKYLFESVNAANKTWAHTVYLFENRRGGRVDRQDPTDPINKYPGMSVSDNDQRGKAWYAPAGATCMLIYGTYTKDGQMNDVVYKVYLGENPINDYNLFRGKHYNYNVTINGLTNINVDTNVEWGSASFSVDHSDNLMMDAHPDFRVFRIAGTAVDASTPAYATVELLEADGVTPCSWLAVSPLNLYRHAVKQSGNANQQFASGDGVGSYVRTRYTSMRTNESEFSIMTFGMTRKLTKIPFLQPAVYTYQNIIVYADPYEGTSERMAKVKITYYKGVDGTEKAGELTYDITQSGAIRISDDLYIERYEESAMLLHPGLTSGLQNTATMQWGYNTASLYSANDRFTNGGYLTANAVYKTVAARNAMDAPTWTATTYADYREMYPRTGAKVAEPSTLNTTGEPYYYPELTSAIQPSEYFHPIFNSSAARYCHEKNRDTDGDGIISAAETQWYLPSFADMWYISNNMPAELSLTGNYWTATEESNTNSWGYTFPAKTGASASKTAAYRVRCVRGTGAIIPDATIESTESDNTQITLESIGGSSGAFNVTDDTGLTWTVTSSDGEWLKIATTTAGAGATATVTGIKDKILYVYATADNPSTTAPRTGFLNLTRIGMAPITITVSQAKSIPPSTVTPNSITLQFMAGESAEFAIDNKNTGLTWTVESDQSWLKIVVDYSGTNPTNSKSGTGNTTLIAYAATDNSSTNTDRTAHVILKRERMMDEKITVVQHKKQILIAEPNVGWAGSNIYWDPTYTNIDGTQGRLTFDDVNVTAHQKYMGVYFQYGSLVAISPIWPYDPTTSIIFAPGGGVPMEYNMIPRLNTLISTNESYRTYLSEYHDPKKNIGDICKYITNRGWAPGIQDHVQWRMPTNSDVPTKEYFKLSGIIEPTPATDRNGCMEINVGLDGNTGWVPMGGVAGIATTMYKQPGALAVLQTQTPAKAYNIVSGDEIYWVKTTDSSGQEAWVARTWTLISGNWTVVSAPVRCVKMREKKQ